MNIYVALQHVFIGYGIQRYGWRDQVNHVLFNDQLFWNPDTQRLYALKTEALYTLAAEDWAATDWETI